jgi:hypothetical protein
MQQTFLGIGSRIKHAEFGIGVVTKIMPTFHQVTFMQFGNIDIPLGEEGEIVEALPDKTESVSLEFVTEMLNNTLEKWNAAQEIVALGDKWIDGMLVLKPQSEDLKPKEVPIEAFFHKIVMVRDRLRVMEQRINSSKNLNDEEKVNLQQYLTRIYGSLTTFNVLFKYKKDHFKGSKS